MAYPELSIVNDYNQNNRLYFKTKHYIKTWIGSIIISINDKGTVSHKLTITDLIIFVLFNPEVIMIGHTKKTYSIVICSA